MGGAVAGYGMGLKPAYCHSGKSTSEQWTDTRDDNPYMRAHVGGQSEAFYVTMSLFH